MGYIIKPIGKSQPRENVKSMHAIYVLYGCMCMYYYLYRILRSNDNEKASRVSNNNNRRHASVRE
jgi:hypothetical protein